MPLNQLQANAIIIEILLAGSTFLVKKKKQNKLNRFTYGINFWQDHTRYPTSALSYFQTCEGFPGVVGGVTCGSGGRPGKNAVIRCWVAIIRAVSREGFLDGGVRGSPWSSFDGLCWWRLCVVTVSSGSVVRWYWSIVSVFGRWILSLGFEEFVYGELWFSVFYHACSGGSYSSKPTSSDRRSASKQVVERVRYVVAVFGW